MSEETEFNPNSLNATLARILAAQAESNRKADAILAQVVKTNGRVTALETWRAVVNAKTALIAGTIAGGVSLIAWAVNFFLR